MIVPFARTGRAANAVPYAVSLVFGLAPCVVLLAYYLWQVRSAPEPWPGVVACVGAGALACGLSIGLFQVTGTLGLSEPVFALLVVGPIEEALKLAAVLIALQGTLRFTRQSSGLVYMVAGAMGFAAVENVAYVSQYGIGVGLLRTVTAVPAHALHSALMGLALGRIRAEDTPRGAWRLLAFSWLLAALAHGIYDAGLSAPASLRGLVALLLLAEFALVAALFRQAWNDGVQRDIALLSRLPLLEQAPVAAVRRLVETGVNLRVAAGQVVVHEGRPGHTMFIILRGALDARRGADEQLLREMGRGDVFGEQALLTGQKRSANVVARADSLLLRVSREGLHDAVRRVDGFAESIVQVASERADEARIPTVEELEDAARDALAATSHGEVSGSLLAHLRGVDVLSELRPEEYPELAAICTTVRRGPHMTIISQKRIGRALFLILVGQLEVLIDGRVVATMGEGDFFGEISLLTGWKTSATVRSTTPIELGVLQWEDLEGLLGRIPSIGVELLAGLARRARATPISAGPTVRKPRLIEAASQDSAVLTMQRRFVELSAFPASVTEALLADLIAIEAPVDADRRPPGIWFQRDGRITGLHTCLVERRAPAAPELPAWHLPGDSLADVIARNPGVLRLFARVLCRESQRDLQQE